MCGLVGVLSKSMNGFIQKEKDIFNELLYADTLRGDDSTGIMMVDTDGNLDLAKEATDAQSFQRSDDYQKLLNRTFRDGAAIIGHNRKATRGVINDENAHPFVVDDRIVLVHNGTLYGDHKKIADVEVDSHAIAHLIHKNGDDVEAALREVYGAYALIWYDVHNRSMNFIRNDQRPLCYVETTNSWVWASEGSMLAWILSRNQTTLAVDAKIQMLPPGVLVTFKREGRRWVKEERKLDLTRKTTHNALNDEDACFLPTDRHPYSSAYWGQMDDDEDDAIITNVLQTPAANVALPSPAIRAISAHNRNMTIKVLDGESERARKMGCTMGVKRYEEIRGKYSSSTWVTGEVFDYDYVKGDTVTHGVFLYARLIDDPDMMIRCYVPYEAEEHEFEYNMIDFATKATKMAFHVLSNGWHKHPEGDITEGFGCYYADKHSIITQLSEVQVEATLPVTY